MSDWPPVQSAPTMEMEFIGKSTLAAPAASISFSLIAPTYLTFEVDVYWVRDGNAGNAGLRLNNDSGSNYRSQEIVCDSDGPVNPTSKNQSGITYHPLAYNTTDANLAGSAHAVISKPLASLRAKGTSVASHQTGGTTVQATQEAWQWSNTTDLINRIDIISVTNNFAAGTRVAVGGGRAA